MDCWFNFNRQVKWDKKLVVLGGSLKGSSDGILGLCSMNYTIVYVVTLSLSKKKKVITLSFYNVSRCCVAMNHVVFLRCNMFFNWILEPYSHYGPCSSLH